MALLSQVVEIHLITASGPLEICNARVSKLIEIN